MTMQQTDINIKNIICNQYGDFTNDNKMEISEPGIKQLATIENLEETSNAIHINNIITQIQTIN